jgi:hypothetical protein
MKEKKPEIVVESSHIEDKEMPKNTIHISEIAEKNTTTIRSDVVVKFDT